MDLTEPELVAAGKALPTQPRWLPHTGDWLVLASALDIDGVTVEGLQLSAGARRSLPDEAVRFQLLHTPRGQKPRPIWRVEWRPRGFHVNRGVGPPELRYRKITGTHHHPFALNWQQPSGPMRRGNLPVAVPIDPDLPDYASLLAFIGGEFRIANMGGFPVPPWEGVLL